MTETSDRLYSRDVIERYLERSWVAGRIPARALDGYRIALIRLDEWLQRHRGVTLSTAAAPEVRALLDSSQWLEVAHDCSALLGLLTEFYQSLQDCRFRKDDPIETLIDQELFAAAIKRDAADLLRHDLRRSSAA